MDRTCYTPNTSSSQILAPEENKVTSKTPMIQVGTSICNRLNNNVVDISAMKLRMMDAYNKCRVYARSNNATCLR